MGDVGFFLAHLSFSSGVLAISISRSPTTVSKKMEAVSAKFIGYLVSALHSHQKPQILHTQQKVLPIHLLTRLSLTQTQAHTHTRTRATTRNHAQPRASLSRARSRTHAHTRARTHILILISIPLHVAHDPRVEGVPQFVGEGRHVLERSGVCLHHTRLISCCGAGVYW